MDEWTNVKTVLTPTDVLTAALPVGTPRAAVNPVTNMAATHARVMAAEGIPLSTAVDAANAGVAGLFNIPSTFGVLPAPASNGDQLSTATWIERTYGLIMGGIAQLAASLNVRAIDLAEALANDLSDGILDGRNGTTSILIHQLEGVRSPYQRLSIRIFKRLSTSLSSQTKPHQLTEVQIPGTPGTRTDRHNSPGRAFFITTTVLPAWTENQFGSTKLDANGECASLFLFAESKFSPGRLFVEWLCYLRYATTAGGREHHDHYHTLHGDDNKLVHPAGFHGHRASDHNPQSSTDPCTHRGELHRECPL